MSRNYLAALTLAIGAWAYAGVAAAQTAADPVKDVGVGADERTAYAISSREDHARAEAERTVLAEASTPADSGRLAREPAARSADWQRRAEEAARAAGAIWSFAETLDRVAEERTLRAQAVFGDGEKLAVEITFECTIAGRDRRLRAIARGFDRKSGESLAFRTEGEGSFGVRTRFRLDDRPPQEGLLFREREAGVASILELPVTSEDLEKKSPRAGVWLRHYAAAVDFNFVAGTVSATIAPYAENLRRVLEACAR